MRTGTAALAALAALAAAAGGFAQVQDRFRVSSDPEGVGYPPSLNVVFDSPPDYVRESIGRLGNDGHWTGPRYQATLRASLGSNATIDWSAGVERDPATRATIIESLAQGWPAVQEGVEPIERRIAGRETAPVNALFVLTQGTPQAGEARYELGLVLPICGRTVIIRVSALTPSGNSAGGAMGFGEYRMANGQAPTVWNREQTLATMRGISLDGNLPAANVAVRAAGRSVVGTATDCYRAPIAGTAATLERRGGKRWVRAARATTNAAGAATLHARAAGTYRIVVGGRPSAAIRVR